MKPEEKAYQNNPNFWTQKGDKLTVIGDYLGRLPSIELIATKPGETILDAGCGAGFIARRLAKQGAILFGCDRNEKLLAQAIAEEKNFQQGISYDLADITKLHYNDEMFDTVACIAVLIHDSPEECNDFFAEAHRVLKPGGRIITSIMHPYLYQSDSPNRTRRASWAQYTPLKDKPMTESQRFNEKYRNSKGEFFDSVVWYHPAELFPVLLKKQGFEVIKTQNTYVTQDVLIACNQTGETGYPAFYQVLAIKK